MSAACSMVGCAQKDASIGEHLDIQELQIVGDSYKHRRGEPLPASSAIFDGATVALRGVRGETLGVQVLLSEHEARPRVIELALDAPGVTVQPFRMDWIEVLRPSTAMYGPSRGPGWYPDRLVPTRGAVRTDRAVFYDVAIAADATPSRRQGTLTVDERRIPVILDIERAAIDLHPEPLVWVWYDHVELAVAHDLAPESPEALALETRYAQLFRAHGAFVMDSLTPEQLRPRESFAAGARYWPVLPDRSGNRQRFQASIKAWIEYFRDRPEIPFAIPIDEPRTSVDRRRVRRWAEWAREAGAGGDRFLFAVTDYPRPIYGDAIDVYLSWLAVPRRGWMRRGAHRWTYNGMPGHAGSMILDTDGAALRTWGWIAYRYQVPLWYAWAGMYYRDVYNHRGRVNVLRDPITFRSSDEIGNGDGLLAYPDALPSLRLKALRRGLQDRKLLLALAACAGEARARTLARQMIPGALAEARRGASPRWPTDEPAWERARHDLLDALASCP